MKRLLWSGDRDLSGEDELRREIGEIDSLDLRHVMEIAITFRDQDETLCRVSFRHGSGGAIVLVLSGVKQLTLPEVTAYPLVFGELMIADIRGRGMEGIAYSLSDLSGFHAKCSGLAVARGSLPPET